MGGWWGRARVAGRGRRSIHACSIMRGELASPVYATSPTTGWPAHGGRGVSTGGAGLGLGGRLGDLGLGLVTWA